MDIEKVIAYTRKNSEPKDRDMANSDTFTDWSAGIGTLLPKAYARALLTEIDYWRARCGKAEQLMGLTPIQNIPDKETSEALSRWQRAVCGSADSDGKARYLETLAPAFTCLGGDHGKGIKPCTEWCGEEMCKPVE